MTPITAAKDLVVLTADKNAQFAIQGILSRCKSLSIRQLGADYFIHPEKDPGAFHHAHDFLRSFTKSHHHALVLMDREGSGQEQANREEMQAQIEKQLFAAGWGERAAAVVIDPEVDVVAVYSVAGLRKTRWFLASTVATDPRRLLKFAVFSAVAAEITPTE